MNESAWKRLIKQLREGHVVPVVGPQLLQLADGVTVGARVAQALLALHGEQLPAEGLAAGRELDDAVARLKPRVKLQDLYSDVHDAFADVLGAGLDALPAPLAKLAEIDDFRMFVTLTPDDLLARALRRRRAVNEIVHAPRQASELASDLAPDWAQRPHEAQLLYLLGRAGPLPTYAIHDEDVLEFTHNLMAHDSQVPQRFVDELRRRSLLLLGCQMPDWLSRFFLRLAGGERLARREGRSWLVEDPAPEPTLVRFLGEFAPEVEVLAATSPAAFVDELHRRWLDSRPADAAVLVTTGAARAEPPPAPVFFISYSRRTDLPRAYALFEALRALGATENEIWFDREAIEPGHDFRQRILDGIQSCRHFLPLLSDAATQRDEAYVFSEWRAANRRRESINRPHFALPVVVDADYQPERYRADPVLRWHEDHIDFAFAPEGQPDARTLKLLQRLLREARLAQPHGA